MTQERAEELMMQDAPVKCKGIEYRKIDSVIIKKKDGKRYIQLTLLDKGSNSITVDALSAVSEIGEEVEVPF